MQRTFKTLQSLRVTFYKSTRNFSVSSINNRVEQENEKQKIKSSPNPNTKGPHPLAILAVLSVGVSAYITLVKSRGIKSISSIYLL